MPTVPGFRLGSAFQLDNSGVSDNILTLGADDFVTKALTPSVPLSDGAPTFNEPIDIEPARPAPVDGGRLQSYGDYWFERIHLLPAKKAYPFILSPQHLFVEVYNAWRRDFWSVDVINEVGPAGVSIVTPYVLPINFYPMQSRVYDILVDAAGAPRADNFITWDFDGTTEPTLHITGLRLLPFTISPDWDKGIDDLVAYATDVMRSYDTTEQRMMLRAHPNRSLSYVASALDDRESGLLNALLWSWQARSYGVLLWMDGRPLLADVVAGGDTVLVDTTQMTLVPGDTVIVISDAFNWFASPVEALDAGSITLETALDRDFVKGKTAVIPVILGRVADSLPVQRPTNASSILPIKFDLEVVKLV